MERTFIYTQNSYLPCYHLLPSPIASPVTITYHYHQRATERICRQRRWALAMDDNDGPRYFGRNLYAVESPFQSIHK